MKKWLYVIMFILSLEIAFAAILHGTIYDAKLDKLNNGVVEINSTPPQIFVSKEGQYSFVLEPGSYEITAKYKITESQYLYVSENVTISRNGYFLKDLFLKPAKKVDMPTGEVVWIGGITNYPIIAALIIIVLTVSLGYTVYRLKFANSAIAAHGFDSSTNDLLKVIKDEGGRTTQRDIRKKVPLSEAKISLMITELENKGLLKKIKKGRGNVIILEKK